MFPKKINSDKNWWLKPEKKSKFKGRKIAEIKSIYLKMKDGVKIAMDIYFPEKIYEKEKFPVIFHQSRYYRKIQYKFPFSLFLKQPGDSLKNLLINNGYIWISIDVRGTGASTGIRTCEFSKKELMDALFILDWITHQSWCDGRIGCTGTSYNGTAGEFLALSNHPSLKAVVSSFSLFDLYSDLVFPGGIHFEWFTKNWTKLNYALDNQELATFFPKYVNLIIKNVATVEGEENLFDKAKFDHRNNWNPHEEALSIQFRDDVSKNGIKLDSISPHNFLNPKLKSRIPMLFISGWYDGAYQNAAIKKILQYKNEKNKLILGPWDHGGSQNVSPYAKFTKPSFDFGREILRFFDHHIRGLENGLENEKSVHYFTMGKETWKESDSFPIPSETIDYFIHPDKSMFLYKPIQEEAINEFRPDYSHGTGAHSRWRSMVNPLDKKTNYKKRYLQYKKNFTLKSLPTLEDMDLTGICEVTLFLKSSEPDGHIFVYLDEQRPNGKVHYITEGMLRLSLMKESGNRKKNEVLIQRSFSQKDFSPLTPGNIYEVKIQMLPISYTIKKGSSILLSLAGSDVDCFKSSDHKPIYDLVFGYKYPSCLSLPIEKNEEGKHNFIR